MGMSARERAFYNRVVNPVMIALIKHGLGPPTYAVVETSGRKTGRKRPVPVASGLDVDQLHFDYAVSGDKPAWRPLRAFDDGRQTFIEFPATLAVGDAPPLFLVDGKDQAQLVNYRLRGRYYVVDRLFDIAELRLGTKHQIVVRITRTGTERGRNAS